MTWMLFFFFMSVLSVCCCTGFSLAVESCGYSPAAVRGLLTAVASLVVKHRLWGAGSWLLLLSSTDSRVQGLPQGSRAQAQ